ncbi:MAG: TonB-dependent receptor [Myxococcota bacterium]|nr:TonB-dependent receptor [Myxococcota bacterium]
MLGLALVLVSGAAGPHAARSQQAAAPELVPPRLARFAEAEMPPGVNPQDLPRSVELELVVAPDGSVREARVVQSGGEAFDAAALTAAQELRFEPATRDGRPIAARIRFRYVFELRQAPPPNQVPAAAADGSSGAQTESSSVSAAPPEPDAAAVPEPPPPETRLEEEDAEAFGARARVRAPPREAVRRTLGAEEIVRVPGTRGDALRVVELLPGVARPPFGAGVLLVRGAAPSDSQVYFEGAPVPLLYHFGGLTSFVPSRLLDRIDFFPGNFSVRYGRKLGGVLEVSARDPATDGASAVLDVNLIDASALVQTPIGAQAGLAVAARRSYVDFFFENVVPGELFDVVAAPVYWDYQLVGAWRPAAGQRLRLLAYGSSDAFRVVFDEPAFDDPAASGNLDLVTAFHRVQLEWSRRLLPTVDQELTLTAGPTRLDFGLGEAIAFRLRTWLLQARSEWRVRLSPTVRLLAGLDMQWLPFTVRYVGPPVMQGEGSGRAQDPLATMERVQSLGEGSVYRPACYLESDLRPTRSLQLVLGLRLDWFDEIRSWAYDPRLVAIWSGLEATRIKAALGVFSQPPEFQESAPQLGNPALLPLRALHVGLGVERDVAEGIDVGAELFFKSLSRRVVDTPPGSWPRLDNAGVGRIAGLELSARVRPTGRRWFGLFSYTLSRSERRDRPGQGWRLFDFDQPHILSAAAVYRLGYGWEVGATFRLVSGNPQTPITGAVYDANADVYVPVYGAINSARAATFHRLDVRVEKQWSWDARALAVYLDVQNVYNATNPEGSFYNYDFSERYDVPGLPILPSIGVRGEL